MTISRKTFAANVTLPANEATSLYTLMRDSALHWGFETTALTQPSMDSITGERAQITPAANVYIGSDANVRNTAGVGTYQGALAASGEPFTLQDFARYGIVDPNQVFLYSQPGTTLDLVFQGR